MSKLSQDDEVKGLDDDEEDTVIIVTLGGTKIELDRKTAYQSQLVQTALENDPNGEVELAYGTDDTVNKVIEWLKYHVDNDLKPLEMPLRLPMKDLVDHFDFKFIDTTDEVVGAVMVVANYMGITPLVHLCAAKFAEAFRDKTSEEICDSLKIPHMNDGARLKLLDNPQYKKWIMQGLDNKSIAKKP